MSLWILISLWLTGYGYLCPPTLKIIPMPLFCTVAHSLSTLSNLVAFIMLIRESVDMENLRLDMVSLDEEEDKQSD